MVRLVNTVSVLPPHTVHSFARREVTQVLCQHLHDFDLQIPRQLDTAPWPRLYQPPYSVHSDTDSRYGVVQCHLEALLL